MLLLITKKKVPAHPHPNSSLFTHQFFQGKGSEAKTQKREKNQCARSSPSSALSQRSCDGPDTHLIFTHRLIPTQRLGSPFVLLVIKNNLTINQPLPSTLAHLYCRLCHLGKSTPNLLIWPIFSGNRFGFSIFFAQARRTQFTHT